ncbi:ATP-binding protein [Gilvimarinus sp. SDUM040013]|uniref:histidine kinase n=1 Tax=Gilvimarinus gilvus TaxID=3058038 RepID=A0ABU4RUP3_9GAMM|nr:ATP-binding protein [Gilvimarinus sp. SDUM040013]MDO3388436.1 ATP-binding protein [Gilvimarinus sp. SDUM040013]MDX6847986.1 ATP-binding protein [Gilvimarinus sp. SDUM040013]
MHLRHLVIIRFFLILTLLLASGIVSRFSPIPMWPVATVTLSLLAINLASLYRISATQPNQHFELALHLLIDIVAVAALAYYTGGVSNPFLSYILVPVCIAASVLPSLYAWALSALAIALYGALLFWFHPLDIFVPHNSHQHHSMGMNVHMIGMWFNFSLSALLISFFIVRMTATVRQHQSELNSLREEDLRNEQLIGVATQAAGTAHELGTPLSTIKVLLNEMASDQEPSSNIGKDIAVLQEQITQCGNILQRLRQRADIELLTNPEAMPASEYCRQLLDHWQLLRPEATTISHLSDALKGCAVTMHPTIEQAIINVLNNAADASTQSINVHVDTDGTQLIWRIVDDGVGLTHDAKRLIGKQPVSTKPDGLGIGLFLTHASIQRYGGTVTLETSENGGTLTTINLPLGDS